MRTLGFGIAGLVVLWTFLYLHEQGPRDPIDLALASVVATVFAFVILGMIAETDTWTVRNVGLLFVFFGDAFLYGSVAYSRIAGGPTPETGIDVARGFLFVGGVFLAIAVLFYWRPGWRWRGE